MVNVIIKFIFLFFPGKSVVHAQKAYFRLKERVFHGGRPFSSEPLENFLIDEFGKNKMMNSFDHPQYYNVFIIVICLSGRIFFYFRCIFTTLVICFINFITCESQHCLLTVYIFILFSFSHHQFCLTLKFKHFDFCMT